MSDAEPRRFPLWPLLVLPVVAVLVLAASGLLTRGENNGNAAANLIPDLGSRKLLQPANDAPVVEEPGPPANAPSGAEEPTAKDPADRTSTQHEIDTYIAHLGHATKVGDSKGKELAHTSLRKCRPDELVNERLLAAMQSEQHAIVRMEHFAAFHGVEAKDDWAFRALEERNAKYYGTDEVLAPGESDELLGYMKHLLLRLSLEPDVQSDARMLAFLRNLLDTERPLWALEPVLSILRSRGIEEDKPALVARLELELRRFLERATAPEPARRSALFAYTLSFKDIKAFLAQMESQTLRPYLPMLFTVFGERSYQGDLAESVGEDFGLALRLRSASDAMRTMCMAVLEGAASVDEKRALIHGLAEFQVPGAEELIKSGLQRRDGNLGDYLAAFGRILKSPDEIKRLVEFVGNPDAATATGAIQGLRQCGFPEAAAELRRIIEQANNPGVQSQALGALLQRDPDSAGQIVDTYLGPEQEAAVRAVAVAHIPKKNIERMQKIVEDDASPRVRQAALARLGAMKDVKLRSFFHRVMVTERSPLLAQEAKKYHEELKRIEEEEKAKREGRLPN